jgi:hypothetical protein
MLSTSPVTLASSPVVALVPPGDDDAVALLRSKLSEGAAVLQVGDDPTIQVLRSYSVETGRMNPAYVIETVTEQDVVEAVRFAVALNLPLTARSGGHNLGQMSNLQGGVVISQQQRRAVLSHDLEAKTITFQGGCRFGDVDSYTWKHLPGWTVSGISFDRRAPPLSLYSGCSDHRWGCFCDGRFSPLWILASVSEVPTWQSAWVGYSAGLATASTTWSACASCWPTAPWSWPPRRATLTSTSPCEAVPLTSVRVEAAQPQRHLTPFVAPTNTPAPLTLVIPPGIVTEFTERLHYVLDPAQGKEVRLGAFFFDIEHAKAVWQGVLALSQDPDFPDQAFMLPILMHLGGPRRGLSIWFAHYRYDPTSQTTDASTTRWETGLRELQAKFGPTTPLKKYTDVSDGWADISHWELQTLFDIPWAASFYPCGGFVADDKVGRCPFAEPQPAALPPSDPQNLNPTIHSLGLQADTVASGLIDAWVAGMPPGSEGVPFFSTAFYHFGGRAQRSRAGSAWPGNAHTAWLMVTWGGWTEEANKPAVIRWTRQQWAPVKRELQFGYLCAAAYDWRSVHHAAWVHGEAFPLLCELKAKYDPTNVFCNTVNIPPRKSTQPTTP